MNIRHLLVSTLLLITLTGCGAIQLPDIQIPAFGNPSAQDSAPTETLPPGQTPSATPTPTATPTKTPTPTATSPYPISAGTPMVGYGFPAINTGDAYRLKAVLSVPDFQVWQIQLSGDQQKLFISTSNGIYLYQVQGELIANWRHIFTISQACRACMASNRDGSRFAVVTRNAGDWEIQVYDVNEKETSLVLSIPIPSEYRDEPDQGRVALSPDGRLLAYSVGENTLRVSDLLTQENYLSYTGKVDAAAFSPDGSQFVLKKGQEMIFWPTDNWKNPGSILVAREGDVWEFAFTPDGQSVAFVLPTRLRVFAVSGLKLIREMSTPPQDAANRRWTITFLNNEVLRGFGIRWYNYEKTAKVDIAEWNITTGEKPQIESYETAKPDVTSELWGVPLPTGPSPDQIELGGDYLNFQFISNDQLIVNVDHSACWAQITTGDVRCSKDRENRVFSSFGAAYREVREKYYTYVKAWNGQEMLATDPRPVVAVSRGGEFFIMDIREATTDIYPVRFVLPAISLPGPFRSYAENPTRMAISTLKEPGVTAITAFEKMGRKILYQKTGYFILKPIVMSADGSVYFLKDAGSLGQYSLNKIDGRSFDVYEEMSVIPVAKPNAMALSPTGLVALGLQDGSIILMSPQTDQQSVFQATHSPIANIAFSNDGVYLAIAGEEGIRVFAVAP